MLKFSVQIITDSEIEFLETNSSPTLQEIDEIGSNSLVVQPSEAPLGGNLSHYVHRPQEGFKDRI